jgi:gliding motility-associated-like protein
MLPSYTGSVATSDNCGGVTVTQSPAAGTILSGHNTSQLITLTATDAAGNSNSCSFTITLKDAIAPTISSCPSNANVSVDNSCNYTLPSYTGAVTTSDNCGGVTVTQSPAAGTILSGHNTSQLITLTAIDAAGNSNSCSFTITLKDAIAPTISSCPSNANVSVDNSCNFSIPSYTSVIGASDNCGGVTVTQLPAAGTILSGHNTSQLITLTATDAAGNTSTCSFTITLKDTTAPIFSSCPSDIHASSTSSCTTAVSWTIPIASDNCSTASVTSNHSPGDTFSAGSTTVTYTATDATGNTSTCSFKVIVANSDLPVLANCPTDIQIEAGETGEATATWTQPTASIICGNVSLTSSHSPGDSFPVGTTEVKYVATRDDGVSVSCTFNVDVTYMEVSFKVNQLLTPDGDGINDKLKVENLELFKDNRVVIVDRWGGTIYSASGYNSETVAWDGSSMGGGKAPSGTYFYTISVWFRGKKFTKNGFIELLRQ